MEESQKPVGFLSMNAFCKNFKCHRHTDPDEIYTVRSLKNLIFLHIRAVQDGLLNDNDISN